MSAAPHSDLEAVPMSEVTETQKFPYYSPEPAPEYWAAPGQDTHKIAYATYTKEQKPQSRTIFGLSKRTFYICLILGVVLVAGAVGGAVGGAMSSKNEKKKSTADTKDTANIPQSSQSPSHTSSVSSVASMSSLSSMTSSTATPTSSQASTQISTTTLVGPSSTITRDCPSSNHTLYDISIGDTKMTFRKACSSSYINAFGQKSIDARVVNSLDDCINFCAQYNVKNQTEIRSGSSKICNAVCWRNTFDKTNDFPGGQCFTFTTSNTTSGDFKFQSPPEKRCDGAALINEDF